jgi:hypothetical protein
VQIFFFEKESQEQSIESREEVPVQESQIVADRIRPKVGELDALSFSLCQSLAFGLANENLLRNDFEPLQASEEIGL